MQVIMYEFPLGVFGIVTISMPSYDNDNDGKKLIRDTDYCYLSPHFSGNRYWSQSRMLFFKNVIMMLAILASFDIFINFLIHFMTPVEP